MGKNLRVLSNGIKITTSSEQGTGTNSIDNDTIRQTRVGYCGQQHSKTRKWCHRQNSRQHEVRKWWQPEHETWNMNHETWNMKHETWKMKHEIGTNVRFPMLNVIVLYILWYRYFCVSDCSSNIRTNVCSLFNGITKLKIYRTVLKRSAR